MAEETSTNQWNHVAVVYNSTTSGSEQLEFYINGELDVAYPCAFTFTPNDEPRYIGSEDGGSLTDMSANMSYWDGKIDELGIWKRVLNSTEIAALADGQDFTQLPDGLSFNTTNGVISGTPTDHTFPDTRYIITATNDGGYDDHIVNIIINDQIATISYSPSAQVYTRGTVIANWSAILGGGAVVTYEVEPALPAGLLINTSGQIYGTPTNNQSIATYKVYANNSGGSNATIQITVNEPIPVLSTLSAVTLLRGSAMSATGPTNTGGNVATWAIHPTLPAGLSFANGVISGTPSVNLTTTTYTIYGNNTGGSANTTIDITINEPVANLGSITDKTFTRDQAITNIVATNSGGAVATWAIHPTLPAGLSMTNGVISGTPTVNFTQTLFTLYANNTGGSDSVQFRITVNEPIAVLAAISNQVFVRDSAITNVVASNTGGAVATWAIYPTLPSGLSMTGGVISGTPTVNQTTAVTYTLYANNTGGSASRSFTITINEPSATLSIADQVLTRDSAMTPVTVSNTGGAVATWGIHPALPSGLSFNNGVLSGTPTVNLTQTQYTVYANNTGGSSTTTFDITVNEPVANLGSIADQTYIRDTAITNLVASNTGGAVATWAIHPTLPAGLTFSNGVISGTPTVNQTTAVTYTLYANNSGGSDSETFTITINEPVANLGAIADQTFTRDSAITNIVPSNTGGAVATWAIHPTLPAGLSMTNGVISGTPTVNQTTAVTYTLYANNSGGSDSETFTITINEPVANLGAIASNIHT